VYTTGGLSPTTITSNPTDLASITVAGNPQEGESFFGPEALLLEGEGAESFGGYRSRPGHSTPFRTPTFIYSPPRKPKITSQKSAPSPLDPSSTFVAQRRRDSALDAVEGLRRSMNVKLDQLIAQMLESTQLDSLLPPLPSTYHASSKESEGSETRVDEHSKTVPPPATEEESSSATTTRRAHTPLSAPPNRRESPSRVSFSPSPR